VLEENDGALALAQRLVEIGHGLQVDHRGILNSGIVRAGFP